MSALLQSFNHPVAAVPSGSALTLQHDGELILWLFGDIDLAISGELDTIAGHALRVGQPLTIEASRIAFCDLTFAAFLGPLATALPVRLRRPSRRLVELLELTGVIPLVKLED